MNKIVIFLTFFCLSFSSLYSFAEDSFFPAPILSLSDGITPHALVVEKATNTLSIYENQENKPRLLKSFKIGTGKLSGDKKTQGDSKTPEGAYRFLEFYSKQELVKRYGKEAPIYGIGAFTISYPNIFDLLQKKTGGGIWLHSTNDNSRINQGQTSRGCVVVTDEQLKEISQYVSLRNTPILIVQELNFLETKTWEKNRNKLLQTIEGWRKAWEQENLDDYISYYDYELFKSGSRGKIKTYKTYKAQVFSHPGKPSIQFTDVTGLAFDDYALVQIKQHYKSSILGDTGKKVLYLKKDQNYEWKIVSEDFERWEAPESQVAGSLYFGNSKI